VVKGLKDTYIVDTPGFFETRGIEIEISNFTIINATI